ncbi:hypothetical protein ARMSODRAFT_977809 [Armillaria solidipes]|uniref:Uncharacterized protein n=1 Tax=Armillaria solidipes TaxID=1076256 RepID=A0A2H3B5M8_9AGAR|nr:hypothetical protein ARMSODRAFT_977809 [Armillaria solidipes]
MPRRCCEGCYYDSNHQRDFIWVFGFSHCACRSRYIKIHPIRKTIFQRSRPRGERHLPLRTTFSITMSDAHNGTGHDVRRGCTRTKSPANGMPSVSSARTSNGDLPFSIHHIPACRLPPHRADHYYTRQQAWKEDSTGQGTRLNDVSSSGEQGVDGGEEEVLDIPRLSHRSPPFLSTVLRQSMTTDTSWKEGRRVSGVTSRPVLCMSTSLRRDDVSTSGEGRVRKHTEVWSSKTPRHKNNILITGTTYAPARVRRAKSWHEEHKTRNQNGETIIEDSSDDDFAPTQRIDVRRARIQTLGRWCTSKVQGCTS